MSNPNTSMLAAIDRALLEAPPEDRIGLSVGHVATRLRLGIPAADSGLLDLPLPARLAALRHTASLGEPANEPLAAACRDALAGTPPSDPALAPLRLWVGEDPGATLEALPLAHRLHALSQALRFGAAPSEAALDALLTALPPEARAPATLVWIHWRLARPDAPDLNALTARVGAMDAPAARLAGLVDLAARRDAPPDLTAHWATMALAAHPAAAAFHAPGVAECQLAMVLRLTQPADALALLAHARSLLSNLPQAGDRALLFDALLPASAFTALEAWREAASTLVADPILRRAPELFGRAVIGAARSIEHLPDAPARDAGLSALVEVARSIASLPLRLVFKAEAARWAAQLPGRSPASLLGEVDTDLDRLFGDRLGLPLLPSIAASYAVADFPRALLAAARIRRPAHRVLWLVAVADRLAVGHLPSSPE